MAERDKTDEAKNASEIRYRRLFEAAKEGILVLDTKTGMAVDVNPFLIQLLGISRDEFLEKAIWELGLLKDLIANKANFEELQNKGYVRYEDLPLETKDGRHIDVEFVSNVYEVDHAKVIQCNIRDITERKKIERALIISENKFSQAFRTSQEMLAISKIADTKFLEVNDSFLRYSGYTRDEVIGHTNAELNLWADPEDGKRLRMLLKEKGTGMHPVLTGELDKL